MVDSSCTETTLYHSQSNQDLYNLYDDRAVDYPEHVLKVYKPDQTCKYLLVHKVRRLNNDRAVFPLTIQIAKG